MQAEVRRPLSERPWKRHHAQSAAAEAAIHIFGAVGLAGLLGLASGSRAVFAVVAAMQIAGSIYVGEIRPGRRGRRRE